MMAFRAILKLVRVQDRVTGRCRQKRNGVTCMLDKVGGAGGDDSFHLPPIAHAFGS